MYLKWYSEGKLKLPNREDTLTLPSQEGGNQIEIISTNKSSRILGVGISPDGSSKEHTI